MRAFVEQAYSFPVSVVPRVEGGAVTGLSFLIDPHFVPTYGTLVLSAAITRPGYDPATVKCAVHYVRSGDGFRYRALADGTPLPPTDDLAQTARRQAWAPSAEAEVTVRLPDGTTRQAEHDVLAVHAGSGLRKLARHLTDPLRTAASEAVARPRALPVLGMIARSRALGGELSEALAGGRCGRGRRRRRRAGTSGRCWPAGGSP